LLDLAQLRVFVAVAEEGGFAAAARRLGMSPPAVTRAVSALEAQLGVRLLHRTTRHVRRTDAGERLLHDSRRILAEVEEAAASARGAQLVPQGELALTAPVMFGRLHVAPVLLDFLAQHPQVSARVMFLDRVVHLLDEGFDAAVRIAHLDDSSLSALRVGQVRRIVVASPAYLAAQGEPLHPQELGRHHGIGFARPGGGARRWEFAAPGGVDLAEVPQPRLPLLVNSVEAALAAALAGQGLAAMLSYQVRDEIAAGRLVRVLRPYERAPIPVHLLHVEGRRAAAKVRAFVDFAAARLREAPALHED
jgi:DNA-binding transcriptional LysR family regulator